MFSRKLLVGAMVTLGGVVLATKALLADKELRDDAKEKGKRLAKDAEEFVDSLGKVASDTASKVMDEGKKVVNEFKEAAEEAKEKLNKESAEQADTTDKTEDTAPEDTAPEDTHAENVEGAGIKENEDNGEEDVSAQLDELKEEADTDLHKLSEFFGS